MVYPLHFHRLDPFNSTKPAPARVALAGLGGVGETYSSFGRGTYGSPARGGGGGGFGGRDRDYHHHGYGHAEDDGPVFKRALPTRDF